MYKDILFWKNKNEDNALFEFYLFIVDASSYENLKIKNKNNKRY